MGFMHLGAYNLIRGHVFFLSFSSYHSHRFIPHKESSHQNCQVGFRNMLMKKNMYTMVQSTNTHIGHHWFMHAHICVCVCACMRTGRQTYVNNEPWLPWLFINSRNTWGNWVFDMVSDLLNHSAITQIRWIVSIYRSQTELSMTGPVSFPILSHQPQLCTKDKFLTRMCRQEINTCMNRSRSSTNHDDLFSYLS